MNYITSIVKNKWGNTYVLVTVDGLAIVRNNRYKANLKFWKSANRKIFAVKKEQASAAIAQDTDDESSSGTDYNSPPRKAKKEVHR